MNCSAVQKNLSLYLYQELEFSEEDALEAHLDQCAACQFAFAREKFWHTELKADRFEFSNSLLEDSRRQLFQAVRRQPERALLPNWLRFAKLTVWSRQIALASFFVFAGAAGSRFLSTASSGYSGLLQMGLIGNAPAQIRDIQPKQNGRVRIVLDRVQQQELEGSASDSQIRSVLLNAARNSSDPGLRVDSVELLGAQDGEDVRNALIAAAQQDTNAAVRLKAVNALGSFSGDRSVRKALISILRYEANPAIRSAAIDMLLPANARVEASADLLGVLQELSRASDDNDYVRARSYQILQAIGAQSNAGDIY